MCPYGRQPCCGPTILLEHINWTLADVTGPFLLELYLFLEYRETSWVSCIILCLCDWFDLSVNCVYSWAEFWCETCRIIKGIKATKGLFFM